MDPIIPFRPVRCPQLVGERGRALTSSCAVLSGRVVPLGELVGCRENPRS